MVFGWADQGNIHSITNEVYERGRLHLLSEYNKANGALGKATTENMGETHKKGRLLLENGGERELGMLNSIAALLPENEKFKNDLENRKKQTASFVKHLKKELEEEYERQCNRLGCKPVQISLSDKERELARLFPVPVPGVIGTSSYFGDYYEKVLGKENLASFNLHPSFAYGVTGYTEAHNFIDGKKNILQIFQATQAELWSEGYPALHDISLIEVENYMRMLEAAKVITIEKRD
jgi:hypothetical protein